MNLEKRNAILASKIRQKVARLRRTKQELDYVCKELLECGNMQGIGNYLRHRRRILLRTISQLSPPKEVNHA